MDERASFHFLKMVHKMAIPPTTEAMTMIMVNVVFFVVVDVFAAPDAIGVDVPVWSAAGAVVVTKATEVLGSALPMFNVSFVS